MLFPRDGLRWDTRDLEILRSSAGVRPAAEIGAALRRSPEAVHQKAWKLGISLVRHTCAKGHPMVREKNRWRCHECRTEYAKEYWRKGGISKEQAQLLMQLIEEYAECKSANDWDEDQGWGESASHKALEESLATLNAFIEGVTHG